MNATLKHRPTPRNIRLAQEDLDRIDALGRRWGPVKALSLGDVVRVALRRAYASEFDRAVVHDNEGH